MENVAFGVTEVAQPRQQIVEIAPVGFVGADVLCGIDGVEVNAEFAVAGCEALAIDQEFLEAGKTRILGDAAR